MILRQFIQKERKNNKKSNVYTVSAKIYLMLRFVTKSCGTQDHKTINSPVDLIKILYFL